MKFKTTFLATALAISIGQAHANDWTVNAVIKNETAAFTKSGEVIGDRGHQTTTGTGATYMGVTTASTPQHSSGDLLKSETSARIFVNGEIGEGSSLHAELRPVFDSQAANNDYEGHQNFTQADYLRELYIDTKLGDVSIRAGKQQVVWGTADGMKLLDIINPTDYREMAQNSMEESRIPVWMLNAEKYLDNGDNVQMILAQPRENVFAGLNRNTATGIRSNYQTASGADDTTLNNGTDTGHAYKLMGPDSITGEYNGFLNIAPDLGSIAGRFAGAFNYMVGFGESNVISTASATYVEGDTYASWGADSSSTFYGVAGAMSDVRMHGFTVDMFEAMPMAGTGSMTAALAGNNMIASGGSSTGTDLHFYHLPGGLRSVSSASPSDWTGFARAVYNTASNMATALGYSAVTSGNTWAEDYAAGGANTTAAVAFADSLTGAQMLAYGFAPLYNTNTANVTTKQDSAFDYMGSATFLTFDAFGNARSQYIYDMPKDKDLDVAFKYGTHLDNGMNLTWAYAYAYDKNPIINLSWRNEAGETLHTHRTVLNSSYQLVADNDVVGDGYSGVSDGTNESLVVTNSASTTDFGALYGGSSAVTSYGSASGNSAILTFEQTVERVHNLGLAADYSFDTESSGPVVLRGEFLYQQGGYQPVIDKSLLGIGDLVGALQMEKADRFKYVLGADVTALTDMMVSAQFIQERNLDFVDGANRYTTSYANMHLSNGFIKDYDNKEFYSLFLSKPFGDSGEGRWNNIIMLEEGGGRWDRFDVEYSLSNNLIGTFELNNYWGDKDTQFGQLKNTSNVQLGLKYIIE